MNVVPVVYSVKSVGTGKGIQLDGCLALCESWHIRKPLYYCLVCEKKKKGGGHNNLRCSIFDAMDIGISAD